MTLCVSTLMGRDLFLSLSWIICLGTVTPQATSSTPLTSAGLSLSPQPWVPVSQARLFCLSAKLRCPHTPCSPSHLIYISTTWKDQSHVTVNPSNGKLENKDRKPHTDTQKLAETLWVKELLFLLQSQTQEIFLNSYWMTLIPQGEKIPIPLSTCQ